MTLNQAMPTPAEQPKGVIWFGSDGRVYGRVSDEQIETLLMEALAAVRKRSGLCPDEPNEWL
jgi:hypothetical protein